MMENTSNTSAGLSRAPLGKALVVGIGGCGIRILNFLRSNPRAKWLVTLAVDTDGDVLAGAHADASINASADWNSKSSAGCGGDVLRGERAVSHERANLKEHVRGFSLIIVTGALSAFRSPMPCYAAILGLVKHAAALEEDSPSGSGGLRRTVVQATDQFLDGLKSLGKAFKL